MSQSLEAAQQLTADERRRLLAQMLENKASRGEEHPLSFGQERLWLMTRLGPDSPLYNIGVAYQLSGPLDLDRLKWGVDRIAERHAILRTTFRAGTGQPTQRVSPDLPSVFSVTDLNDAAAPRPDELPAQQEPAWRGALPGTPSTTKSHSPDLSATKLVAMARHLAVAEAKRPFDLAQGPLWRVKVFRASDLEHVVVVVMHHIVSDAWSFFVFCQELAELYAASASGRQHLLAGLPIQYAAIGQRQRSQATGPVFDRQKEYWRAHLAGNVPGLLLPTDRPGSVGSTHRGAFERLTIPAAVNQALGELSRRENATMFMTLLAGFEVLLHQYTGQEDLVVCTPASGRHRAQTKELIGYFNNILPMRFDLSGDPSLVETMRRTRAVALDAFRNQDVPFQIIAGSPNLHQVSLCRALFSLDIKWPPALELSGLESQAWAVHTETSDFDLSVSLWLEDDEIRGVVEYKTELFDVATIARMVADYGALLEAVAFKPETAISALPTRRRSHSVVRAAQVARGPAAYEPPGFPTELSIVKEWENILGVRPIGVHDDLFTLGASSLAVAQLSERLRRLFQIEVPVVAIFEARTVRRIAALFRSGGSGMSRPALAAIQPAGIHPPLFLCEGIGLYYPLISHLGNLQPVYGLVTEVARDLPRVEDAAAAYIKEVRALQPEGPYFLGGLSFGGIIAFEMAQQLRAAGQEVALLALFDTPTPWAFTPRSWPGRVAGHLNNFRRFGLRYGKKKLGDRLAGLRRNLRAWRRGGKSSRSEIIGDMPSLREILATAANQYTYRPYDGPATLFTLAGRDGMSDSLYDPALGEIDPQLGWGRLVTGGFIVHEIPGEHLSILREPNVRILAEKLTHSLELARAATSS